MHIRRLLPIFVAICLIFTQTAQAYSLVWLPNTHSTETVKLANISAGKGLSVNATGGIIIDLPAVAAEPETADSDHHDPRNPPPPPPTPEQAARKLAEQKAHDAQRLTDHIDNLVKQPGQEWIGQLVKAQPDRVKLQQVKAAAEHWDYSHAGLTPEAAAVVVIVVTYFTAGAASGAAGAMTGAAAGTTTVASAALAAGMTTLASQASLALINNKGDLGKTLNDLGQSDNVKALVTAMITAGVLQGLSQSISIGDTQLSKINAKSGFTNQLQKNLINQSSSALINHAINGGDLSKQLEQSLKSAFIDTGAAQGANLIGDLKQNGTLNDYTHKLAHAIAGCAAGAAKSNDCSSGALGAVVGEITAELYAPGNTGTPLTAKQQTDTINFSKMIAGVAAALTGNNVNVAAGAAGNAAENNYLLHQPTSVPQKSEAERYADAKKGCASGDASACQTKASLETLSLNRDNQVAQACNSGASAACQAGMAAAVNNGSHISWTPDNKMQVTSGEYPTLSNQDRPQGFDQQLAPSILDAALLEAGNGVIAGVVKGGAAALVWFGASARLPEAAANSTALSTYRYTTEGETFFHYGYSQQAANFADGLRPGGYATNIGELTGSGAQSGLALPHAAPPNAVYVVSPQPGTLVRVNPIADAKFGQPGGLPEFQFPVGTNAGSVSLPKVLP